jgi:hypothetical protein
MTKTNKKRRNKERHLYLMAAPSRIKFENN